MHNQSEYSQLEAYKHLLEVAENIVYSSDTDQAILKKYDQLKKSILKKVTPTNNNFPLSSYQSNTSSSSYLYQQQSYYINLMSIYKNIIQNTIKIISTFQQQLQKDMQRQNYNQLVLSLNENILMKIEDLEENVGLSEQGSRYVGEKGYNNKLRLLHREQVNALRYQYDQLDSKFQNLGLLIEVHKKMHEIILQATKTEQKRSIVDQNYKEKIKQLESQIQQINDVDLFIKQHKITEEKYKEYKVMIRKLGKLLIQK